MAYEILKDSSGKNGIPQYYNSAGAPMPLMGDKAPYSQIIDSSGDPLFSSENPGTIQVAGNGNIVNVSDDGAISVSVKDDVSSHNEHVNRGIVNAGKAVPLYKNIKVSVPGETNDPQVLDLISVPAGKAWKITTIRASGVKDKLSVVDALLDGASIGLNAGKSSLEMKITELFGEAIVCFSDIQIEAINESGAPEEASIILYGWEITL